MFGQVVDGKQYVKEMENQKVDANHRPYADVRITNSGELVLMKKGTSLYVTVTLLTCVYVYVLYSLFKRVLSVMQVK